MRSLAAAAAVVLAVSALARAPAQAADLAAHRALYKLTLDSSHGGNVAAATGTMGYEVIDSCDGWAVRQRLQMDITNNDGQQVEMVSDYATWESKDGLAFRFHMKQTTDAEVTSQTDGDATLASTGGSGVVHYASPQDVTKDLPPGTLFPMAHTAAILAAAKDGKKFLAIPLFDGTGDSGAQDSSVVITGWTPPGPSDFPALANLPTTTVHIAFFDRDAGSQTPDYEVGMRYWENGVADDLKMDFGDFVMAGKMSEFALQPHRC